MIAATQESQKASLSGQNSKEQLFDQGFSRLRVDDSRSYYVNNALWVTLSNEVSHIQVLESALLSIRFLVGD